MTCFTRKFIRDDGTVLEVDGTFRIFDGEVDDFEYKAWLYSDRNDPKAPYVKLTEKEDERLYDEVCDDPNTFDYDDEPEDD